LSYIFAQLWMTFYNFRWIHAFSSMSIAITTPLHIALCMPKNNEKKSLVRANKWKKNPLICACKCNSKSFDFYLHALWLPVPFTVGLKVSLTNLLYGGLVYTRARPNSRSIPGYPNLLHMITQSESPREKIVMAALCIVLI